MRVSSPGDRLDAEVAGMANEIFFSAERHRMVEEQLRGRDIDNLRVLEAMEAVPRHRFIPVEHRRLAYVDGPLPIGNDQTISQPYIVALMTQLLDLTGEERVLEIGTGSGYQAAVLSLLSREVHTIERFSILANAAGRRLQRLGYKNVYVHTGDGTLGWLEEAPYDAIIVTAAAPRAPAPLLDQMAPEARLVIPVGSHGHQVLECWTRLPDDFHVETIAPVAFVPLVGKYGWHS